MKSKTTTQYLSGAKGTFARIMLIFLVMLSARTVQAQAPANDNCSGATSLVQSPACVGTAGTTAGATLSMAAAPCNGNPDDDVWFSFVATATSAQVSLSNVSPVVGTSTDMYFQVLSGACGSTSSLLCSDPDNGSVNGLTIGQTYYIRVYTYGTGNAASFNICVTSPPPPPANDDCSGATLLAQAPFCVPTAGTTSGATLSMAAAPCNGNPDDDVWYSFVATATSAQIALSNVNAVFGTSTDMYFQVLSGACGSTTSLLCSDPDNGSVSGLTVGQTYYIRVYTYGAGNTASFGICVTAPPPPPANDNCSGATSLVQATSCISTAGSTAGATQSMAATPCNGNPDDDVWYSFVATATSAQVALSNVNAVIGTSTDMYFQVLSGACGSTTSLLCSDPDNGSVSGLTIGQTYFIRVYTYGAGNGASFSICVTAPPPPPSNDDCGGATSLVQAPACVSTAGSTAGATLSMAATPCNGNPDDDVWYSFVATATSAQIALSNVNAVIGTSTDMYFQVLSGACGSTTSLLCSDPDNNSVTGLTIGQTYYIRVYTYGAGNGASFNICVTSPPPPPPNDNCGGAVTLTVNPDYNCGVSTNGTTAGATQSTETAPTVGATGTNDDVWYSFTATATAHQIKLTNVSGGTDMAMAIYSGVCGALVHVQSSDPDVMNVTGLTPGQVYKVRVYTYSSNIATSASFTICVGTAPTTPPPNDNCGGAVTLTVNPDYNCGVTTNGTTFLATQSTETAPTVSPAGTNDDVWYAFTATGTTHRITLSNITGGTDMAMAVYSGACGALVHLQSSDPNTMTVSGLTPGQVYKVRVYTYSSSATTTASFTICVGTPPPPPPNDNCNGAVTLVQGATCVNTAGTTGGATLSMAATPCNGNPDDDVWYKFVATGVDARVTLSGITPINGSTSTDMYFQVLSGACGSQTSRLCSDPNTGTVNNLIPGQTYFIRVYTYGAGDAAAFNICVTNVSPPVTCGAPIALTVPAATITANSATLSWTAPIAGPPTGYNWEVRTSGAAGSGPAGLVTSGTTTATSVATGPILSSATVYFAYVRTRCGPADSSTWTPTYFITLCDPPVLLSWKDSSRCGEGIVVLEASTVAGANINWYLTAAGGTPVGTGSPFSTPILNATKTYYVAAVSGTSGTCASARQAVTASVHEQPVVDLGPDINRCLDAGAEILLDAGAQPDGPQFRWDDGSIEQARAVGHSGTYRVDVTTASGCTDSDTINVTIRTNPVVDLGNDTTVCNGALLTLDAGNNGSNGDTYFWSTAATTSKINVNTAGDYFVIVTSSEGCAKNDTITVTMQGELPTMFGVIIRNTGQNTFSFSVNDPQNVIAYDWDFGDGSPHSDQPAPEHTYATVGSYIVVLKLSSSCGFLIDSLSTNVVGIPQITVDQDQLSLYPNPANTSATLRSKNLNMEEIAVYNTLGQLVFSSKAEGPKQHVLHLEGYAPGVYTIRIRTNQGNVIRRLERL